MSAIGKLIVGTAAARAALNPNKITNTIAKTAATTANKIMQGKTILKNAAQKTFEWIGENYKNNLLGDETKEEAEDAQAIADDYFERSNEFNSAEAQKNRDFQLYMSNTAYQRMVEDLKKAGLNPMLAYMNGGASTGGGSTASAAAYEVTRQKLETKQAAWATAANTATQLLANRKNANGFGYKNLLNTIFKANLKALK